MSPLNLDPEDPPLPISSPPGYTAELAKKHGLMKTLGWWHDTWALNEERIDEGVFLEDCWRTMQQEREILLDELKNDPPSLLVSVFTATDSVSHMFWRLTDPQHPRYDAALAAKYGDAIEQTYDAHGRDCGRRDANHETWRHADYRFRPWVPFLAQRIQYQHVAGAERLHDAQESRRGGEDTTTSTICSGREAFSPTPIGAAPARMPWAWGRST